MVVVVVVRNGLGAHTIMWQGSGGSDGAAAKGAGAPAWRPPTCNDTKYKRCTLVTALTTLTSKLLA